MCHKVHALCSFNIDHNASISADAKTFTHKSAKEEQHVGTLPSLVKVYHEKCDPLSDFHGSMLDAFKILYPPSSNFTIYYDPTDPVAFTLCTTIHVKDFVLPILSLPILCLWSIICFKWILIELSMKGARQPMYMEELASDGRLEIHKGKL